MEEYKVYIKTDEENGYVTAINSSAFITDVSGWIEIDQGTGDRYHHAQGNYLDKPITDEYGRHNYRYTNGQVVEIPESEKPPVPAPGPSMMERLEVLEAAMLEVVLGG